MGSLEKTAENLNRHGFRARIAGSAAEAKELALPLIGTGSVGFGGSVTVRDMGLFEALQQRGNAVYWHWKCAPEEVPAVHAAAHTADVYVCSANAVLETGALLNIDGAGNRVGSLISGPKKAIVIAGRNKLCADYEEGLARVKAKACPQNARRLGLKTPCALTGICTDCSSPQRMCHVTALLERPTNALPEVHVLLVDEDLGY